MPKPTTTTMPATIRISGRNVKLVALGASDDLGRRYCGLNQAGAQGLITLDGTVSPDELRSTAVHEILHDLSNLVGADLGEVAVTSLSSVLFAVMRDNPALVAWLME